MTIPDTKNNLGLYGRINKSMRYLSGSWARAEKPLKMLFIQSLVDSGNSLKPDPDMVNKWIWFYAGHKASTESPVCQHKNILPVVYQDGEHTIYRKCLKCGAGKTDADKWVNDVFSNINQ